ncbi:MAG: hypothetical protein ABIF87_13680 [Pseudomonadota bacterium]
MKRPNVEMITRLPVSPNHHGQTQTTSLGLTTDGKQEVITTTTQRQRIPYPVVTSMSGQFNEDEYEIPAFLRKQAD